MKLKTIKTMKITLKVSDMFFATFQDENGEEVHSYDGYVPDYMPSFEDDLHYGDYVMLEIEIATGKILNWKPVTTAQILETK